MDKWIYANSLGELYAVFFLTFSFSVCLLNRFICQWTELLKHVVCFCVIREKVCPAIDTDSDQSDVANLPWRARAYAQMGWTADGGPAQLSSFRFSVFQDRQFCGVGPHHFISNNRSTENQNLMSIATLKLCRKSKCNVILHVPARFAHVYQVIPNGKTDGICDHLNCCHKSIWILATIYLGKAQHFTAALAKFRIAIQLHPNRSSLQSYRYNSNNNCFNSLLQDASSMIHHESKLPQGKLKNRTRA